MYKNPKQKLKAKGSSAMQPTAGDSTSGGGVRLIKGEVGDHSAGAGSGKAVNDETWWKRRVEDVPIDQVSFSYVQSVYGINCALQLFFHKYFNKRNERERAKSAKVDKRRKGKEESGSDESGDEEGGDEAPVAAVEAASEAGSDEDAEEAEIWKVCIGFPTIWLSMAEHLSFSGYESFHA